MPATEEINLTSKIQDISDVLTITNAADMPFTSSIRKGEKPKNTLFSYPIDKYADARTDGVPDGKDADSFIDTQVDRSELYGRIQRVWRNPQVTTLAQEVTEQAGDGGNKYAKAKAKCTVELKQDMEAILLSNNDSAAQTGASNAYLTRGMGSWTSTTAQADAQTAVPAAYRPTAGQIYTGAIGAFNEDALRAVLQARWDNVRHNGELVAYCGSGVKNEISDFTRFETNRDGSTPIRRFNNQESGTFGNTVDLYMGDYGTVKVFKSSFVPNPNTAQIVDMNLVEMRTSATPRSRDLPDLGGGPRAIIDAIFGLANLYPGGHCKIAATA